MNARDWARNNTAYDVWYRRIQEARLRLLKIAGARKATFEFPNGMVPLLSRHYFRGKSAAGRFLIFEVWCDNEDVIRYKGKEAEELAKKGYRIGFLPTKFSTRAIGMRQPVVVVPPGSDVDPRAMYDALVGADFEGVKAPEP